MIIEINKSIDEIAQRKKLLSDWSNFKNQRPPVIVFIDSPFYCKLANIPIEDIYTDPEKMILAQLIGWKKVLATIDCDNDAPTVNIDFGSCFSGSIYGCELVSQPGSVPTTRPWFTCENDLERLKNIDPFTSGLQTKAKHYYNTIKAKSKDYPITFKGSDPIYPLDSIGLMTGSEGSFSIICMIAGLEQISLWCYENPELIRQMMNIVTEKEMERINKTFEFMNKPIDAVFLADDYSPYMPLNILHEFILPSEQKLYAAFTGKNLFHSCIPDKRLLKYWKDDLNIAVFNGFKPQNGLDNIKRDYQPVAEIMQNKVLLEPDIDGANVMIADTDQLEKATNDVLQIFNNPAGVKLCYTLSGGHNTSDLEKCNIIKKTVINHNP